MSLGGAPAGGFADVELRSQNAVRPIPPIRFSRTEAAWNAGFGPGASDACDAERRKERENANAPQAWPDPLGMVKQDGAGTWTRNRPPEHDVKEVEERFPAGAGPSSV